MAARAGSAVSAVSLLGSVAHVGFGSRDPARRHFPATAAGAGAWGRAATRAHLLPPALGKRPGGGAEGVASAGAAAPSQSGGSCKDCAQRPPARGLFAARPPRPAALPASRLTVRGPAPGRHALRPRAPRGPQPAVGASPCPEPPHLGPAAAQLPRNPGPCASDVLSAYPRRPANSEGTRGAAATRPGPGSCHFLSTSNFRASRRN